MERSNKAREGSFSFCILFFNHFLYSSNAKIAKCGYKSNKEREKKKRRNDFNTSLSTTVRNY